MGVAKKTKRSPIQTHLVTPLTIYIKKEYTPKKIITVFKTMRTSRKEKILKVKIRPSLTNFHKINWEAHGTAI